MGQRDIFFTKTFSMVHSCKCSCVKDPSCGRCLWLRLKCQCKTSGNCPASKLAAIDLAAKHNWPNLYKVIASLLSGAQQKVGWHAVSEHQQHQADGTLCCLHAFMECGIAPCHPDKGAGCTLMGCLTERCLALLLWTFEQHQIALLLLPEPGRRSSNPPLQSCTLVKGCCGARECSGASLFP